MDFSGRDFGKTDARMQRTPVHLPSWSTIFVRHGIPGPAKLIDHPMNFTLGDIDSRMQFIKDFKNWYFLRVVQGSIAYKETDLQPPFSESAIKQFLGDTFKQLLEIRTPLAQFSPIEDIRLSPEFNISESRLNERWEISNLFLEFRMAGKWHTFDQLSDGTKRLFYMIAEIALSGGIQPVRSGVVSIQMKTTPGSS